MFGQLKMKAIARNETTVKRAGRTVPRAFERWFPMAKTYSSNINNRKTPMKIILTLGIGIALLGAGLATASAADAKENWEKTCAKCHGPDGKGQTKMGQKMGIKDYTDAKVQAELKDDVAFKSIKEGLKDKEGKVLMKPAEDLSDDDIKALVKYMRSFKK
jgi:cytochrome c553